MLVTFENAKAEDFDIVYSTDGGKTWSATIPGQREIGKLTIKVKATLKSDKSVVLEGEGVVEIIAGTTTKTIGTIVNCRVSVNVRKGREQQHHEDRRGQEGRAVHRAGRRGLLV